MSFILDVNFKWKSEVIIDVLCALVNVESVSHKFFPILIVVWYI